MQQDIPLSGANSGQSHYSNEAPCDANLSTIANGKTKWCQDEHKRFMQALELYGSRQTGNEWGLIAAYVKTRTVEEVRLHGQTYLKRLVQQIPYTVEGSRHVFSAATWNDPCRPSYQISRDLVDFRGCGGQAKIANGGSKGLSSAASECAQLLRIQPAQFQKELLELPHNHLETVAMRQPKHWTFQEEKAFETALARCAGSTSYPWATIAAAIPGKNAKDVCSRYHNMVREIALIESGAGSISTTNGSKFTLSQRAIPPPPIKVPPRSSGKEKVAGIFPSSRKGSLSGITMLSPTFLDFLAKEAESEEKSTIPAMFLAKPAPSPLFSPTLLPSGSPGFFSPGTKKAAARGQQGRRFASTNDMTMKEIEGAGSTTAANKTEAGQNPREWTNFSRPITNARTLSDQSI